MKDKIIEISENNPFEKDEFGREIIARNLTEIIGQENEGLVISIDSNWGTGKTTFVRMWEAMLKTEEYKEEFETLYFNAWKNDYLNDPLLALVSEMELETKKDNDKEFLSKVAKMGKKLVKPVVSASLKALTYGILDIDQIKLGTEYEKQLVELSGKMGEACIDETVQVKETRENFKMKIKKYQEENKKKIVFFIDELDRCRPSFAIELLENIKHLFDMENFIFIISIDKEQLAHSVATVYGSGMDTVGYLRRFFDLEYKLPEVDKIKYINMHNKTIESEYRYFNYFKKFMRELMIEKHFSLRDIDKTYYYIKVLRPFMVNPEEDYKSCQNIVIGFLYAYLIYLKIKEPILYKKVVIKDYSIEIEEFQRKFSIENIKNIDFKIDENIEEFNVKNIIEGTLRYYFELFIQKKKEDGEDVEYLVGVREESDDEYFVDDYILNELFISGESIINRSFEFIDNIQYTDKIS